MDSQTYRQLLRLHMAGTSVPMAISLHFDPTTFSMARIRLHQNWVMANHPRQLMLGLILLKSMTDALQSTPATRSLPL
jgi:hypothetical protein